MKAKVNTKNPTPPVDDNRDSPVAADALRQKIVGTWTLVSWIYYDDNGTPVHYFGESATGLLMYDSAGRMNAQLMRSDRRRFASDSISAGTTDETHAAFNSYLAYFGRYYEEQPGKIVHTVEGSLFPNWLGHREVRYAQIMDDLLLLHTPPIPTGDGETVFFITWKKVPEEESLSLTSPPASHWR